MENKEQLWTKNFLTVSAINFFLTLVFYLLMVTIALYAVAEYDASTSEAGLVTGIFIIGTLIGRLGIGRYMDRIGRMRTLFIGLIFFIVTSMMYFLDWGLSFLLINRFIHGLSLGVASTATGTLVALIIPTTRKGEGIGYYSMSATLATAIGPFIGLYMSQHFTYNLIFSFCVGLALFNLIIFVLLKSGYTETEIAPVEQQKGFRISNYLEPNAIPIAFITLVAAFCYSSVLSFINFFAVENELVSAASYFFLVYSIAILLSRPITGKLFDLKGANIVIYPALVLFAIGMFLLSIASTGVLLLLAGVLIGAGFGNIQSCTQAIAVKLTSPQRMGLATSTFFIFLDAGLGFGPYLLGFLIPFTGYNTLYGILGGGVLFTIFLYTILHGRKDRVLNTH
ncbi:MFS transporter [Chungangia koreensis]|uniref:MFS transporter n=1 Tax=Chungangia koreensis TaxID=752657 RepID=A0ABV8X3P2_9LACT